MGNTKEMSVSMPDTLPNTTRTLFWEIAKRVGTPTYVYDQGRLESSLQSFLAIPAPHGLRVRYAMKANPTAAILHVFNNMGAHIDASTHNEVVRAIEGEAHIPGKKIRLTSQEVQSPEQLKYLADNEVEYTACSLLQLATYGKAFPGTEVGIRFNIGMGSGWNAQTATGGVNSSFGIYRQREEIDALLQQHDLTLTTVHLHIGSGSDPHKQKEAIHEGLALVRDYPDVTTLNMGGGFKVARMNHEKSTDIAEMGQEMSEALVAFEQDTGRKILLEVEPGTALVANAGYVITKITDKVSTGPTGQDFLKVDGGMNVNDRVPLYGVVHPLIVIPQDERKREIKEYVVSGPCCESGDILTVSPGKPEVIEPRLMQEAEVGDLLVIAGAGAYGASMAIKNYNSLEEPAEVMIKKDGDFVTIRARQQPKDIWVRESIPPLLCD